MSNFEKLSKRVLLSVISSLRTSKKIDPTSLPLSLIKRILIVKQHDQLGDLLVATPAIRAVRKKFPKAYIAVVVREYTAPMMWDNPHVDTVMVFYENLKRWTIRYARTLWSQLRQEGGFDCAIVLNSVSRSFSSDLIALLSKAKYIIGPDHLLLDEEMPEGIYNVRTPRTLTAQLEIQHYLDIVRAMGIPADGLQYDLTLSDEEHREAEKVLYDMGIQAGSALVGIHLGALNKDKRLPLDLLAKTIAWIKKNFECKIVLLIGPHEVHLREQLIARVEKKSVLSAPLLPIRISSALIQKLNLLLCNDTGTMHIASALGVPTVSFHSISDPAQWKPPHERHIGIRAADHKISSITLEMITAAVAEQFKRIGVMQKTI